RRRRSRHRAPHALLLAGGTGFYNEGNRGGVAQRLEQRLHKPRVAGSIPAPATPIAGVGRCPGVSLRGPIPWRKAAPMFRALFLHPRFADDVGLVAVGGDLRPERLLLAYRRGVFPCFGEHDPVCWWSPDPRGIFELDGLHLSRRLERTLRGGRFTVTVNRDFAGVIAG